MSAGPPTSYLLPVGLEQAKRPERRVRAKRSDKRDRSDRRSKSLDPLHDNLLVCAFGVLELVIVEHSAE